MKDKDGGTSGGGAKERQIRRLKSAHDPADADRGAQNGYRAMFEETLAMNAVIGPDLTVIDVNRRFVESLGYAKDEVVGKKITDFIVPADADMAVEMIRQDFRGVDTPQIEVCLVGRDGIHTIIFARGHVPVRRGGEVVAVFVSGVDITERRQADGALRNAEAEIRAVFESSVPLIVIGADYNIVRVNRQLCQMMGFDADKIVGRKCYDVVGSDVCMTPQCPLRRIIGGQEKVVHEAERILPDGRRILFIVNATPYRGPDGKLVGIVESINDVTKKKLAEQALARSEKRYRSLVQDMPGLICSFKPGGEIIFVNREYCRYFARGFDELIGSNFLDLIPKGDRDRVQGNLSALTAEEPTITHEHKVTAPSGQVRWQRWTNRALFDEHGRAVAYQSFGFDIPERKQAEQS